MDDTANGIYEEQELEQPTMEATVGDENYVNGQMIPYQGDQFVSLPLITPSPTFVSPSVHSSLPAPSSPPSANRTPYDLQKELEQEAIMLKHLQIRLVASSSFSSVKLFSQSDPILNPA